MFGGGSNGQGTGKTGSMLSALRVVEPIEKMTEIAEKIKEFSPLLMSKSDTLI